MLEVADVRQKLDYDCGAACVVAVCGHFGDHLSLQNATELLHVNHLDGTDPRTMEAFLRSRGLHVLAGNMDVDDLRTQTKRGRPVVAAVRNHWVVVLGAGRARVTYHCPQSGRAQEGLGPFLGRWRDVDRLGAAYSQYGLAVWRAGGD